MERLDRHLVAFAESWSVLKHNKMTPLVPSIALRGIFSTETNKNNSAHLRKIIGATLEISDKLGHRILRKSTLKTPSLILFEVVYLLWFYWMFYDHFSARSLLAKLGCEHYVSVLSVRLSFLKSLALYGYHCVCSTQQRLWLQQMIMHVLQCPHDVDVHIL